LFKSLHLSISGFTKLIPLLLPVLFLVVFPGSVCADSSTKAKHSSEKGLSLIEAVRDTIQKQPDVLLQQQEVEVSKGALQIEAGEFDAALSSTFNYQTSKYAPTYWENKLYEIGDRTYTSTAASVEVEKKTRYGISFGPSVDVNRTHGISDYMIPTSSNQAIVFFNLNVPLLKGRGEDATGAQEMAAAVEIEASQLDLEHTIALSVEQTTVAYWNYLEAQMQLKILKNMEEDSRQTLENMKQLVKGDDRPASDLDTFEADLADKISQRIAGEQNIFEARQDLGLAMGLAYEAIDDLPLPKDTFPDPRKNKSPLIKLGPAKLFEKARNNRADYLSMKKREAEARILLVAATNNLLPQLDINGGIGYAGLEDGGNVDDYFKSIGNKLTGANYSAGITLTFPFGNNEAKGLHLQQRSRLRKAVIQTGNLERKIRSDIVVAFQAILRTSRELKETRRSVKHYRTAVSNERTKFGMGMASVLDVINIQNFLRNTMLSEVRKMNSYAAAVVDLRYQTGALITTHGDGYRVEMEQLISPPQVGGETR